MFTPRLALVFASLSITTLCGNASHAQDVDALSILSLGGTAPKSTGADLSSLKLRPLWQRYKFANVLSLIVGEFVRFQRRKTVNLVLVREVIRASRNAHAEP
jgi:hypothetical protein